MSEPLIIKSDYPTTDNLCHDAYSVSVISPAFASPSGELNAILQYFYHYFNFEKQGLNEYASAMESIAIAEMIHLKLLGKTITALGAPPIYCQNPPTAYNFYSTKYVTYSRDFVNMIEDDILGERHAICQYTKMLSRLKNEQVKNIVSRILEDEKLHLEKLKQILCELKS